MAYLVAAVLPPATVLMSGVFVALILGAFVQVGWLGWRMLEFPLDSASPWSMVVLLQGHGLAPALANISHSPELPL